MKLLFFLTLISTSSWAIDFNKVTGTFEVSATPESTKDYLGETDMDDSFKTVEKGRLPASVTSVDEEKQTHVTEITGTFE